MNEDTDALSWDELVNKIAVLEHSLPSLETSYAQLRAAFDTHYAPLADEIKAAKQHLDTAKVVYKQAVADFESETMELRQRIVEMQATIKRYRSVLKQRATDNVAPRQFPSGRTYRPPAKTFGGVQLRQNQQLRILDEVRAAEVLRGVDYLPPPDSRSPYEQPKPRQLVWAEIVYHFDKSAIRAWLKQDITRQVPGVLELTALDDPASYAMAIEKEETDN